MGSETLTPVPRHRGSPAAFVSVAFDGERLSVTVQDAGRGMTVPALACCRGAVWVAARDASAGGGPN